VVKKGGRCLSHVNNSVHGAVGRGGGILHMKKRKERVEKPGGGDRKNNVDPRRTPRGEIGRVGGKAGNKNSQKKVLKGAHRGTNHPLEKTPKMGELGSGEGKLEGPKNWKVLRG